MSKISSAKKAKPAKSDETAGPVTWVATAQIVFRAKRYVPPQQFTVDRSKLDKHDNGVLDRYFRLGNIRPATDLELASPPPPAMPIGLVPTAGAFREIPRLQIDPSPWNPRQDFESAAAVEYLAGLAQSIREQGIIEPCIVRPLGDTGRFELVAGECRWRAAKLAGLETIPCLVRPLDKLAALRMQAVENLQRRDLNAVEEAHGYQLLMREGECSVDDIVRETGKSKSTIYARLALLEAPPGIRQAVQENRLKATTAGLVTALPRELQNTAMDAILHPDKEEGEDEGGALSFRQAKEKLSYLSAQAAEEKTWQALVEIHGLKNQGTVFTAAESSGIFAPGGYWLRDDLYVKLSEICTLDPERRTWDKLFEASGKARPPLFIARDPGNRTPVSLFKREAAILALGDAIPDPQEYERRQKARLAEAERERESAQIRRREAEAEHAAQIVQVVEECENLPWTEDIEHRFLRRILVAAIRQELDGGLGRVGEILTRRGVCNEDEDTFNWPDAKVCDLVNACTTAQLRGWLLELSFTDQHEDPEAWFDAPTPNDGSPATAVTPAQSQREAIAA